MSGLPEVTPVQMVNQDDVRAVIEGLAPGWYRTRDLWPRYLAWAEREGKTPGTKIRFGIVLRQVAMESKIVRDHVAAHRIG